MKQFVRALNTNGEYFQHIVSVLPALLFKKVKEDVFDESQIHTLVLYILQLCLDEQ